MSDLNRVAITRLDELDETCEFMGERAEIGPDYSALAIFGKRGSFTRGHVEQLIAAGLITKPAPPVVFEGVVNKENETEQWVYLPDTFKHGDKVRVEKIIGGGA